jgi:hypothetical protein
MEKSWIDTEEGRSAILDVANHPESILFIKNAGAKHLQLLTSRVLDANVSDESKDRALIVAKAELDGARAMLKSFIQLLDEAGKPKASRK